MAGKFRILSIDGGGMRGIIPAMVLQEIERRTGRRIFELFDLIAGTSTGGLLALAITKPRHNGGNQYSARDLVNLYEQNGRRIFTRSVWNQIRAIGNVIEEKYPSKPLEDVLYEYFDDAMLSQALTSVLVTGYEIEERRPFFFKSHNARRKPVEDDCLTRDAARATSAAPTYFEPALVKVGSKTQAIVDGGVFANNPAMCALVEAGCKFGQHPDDVFMVSLGTGELTRPLPHSEVKGWGLIQWAQPILNVVFDGVSDTVNYQLDAILNRNATSGQRYYRFQTTLYIGKDDLDDASSTNLYALKHLATEMMNNRNNDIDSVCEALMR